MSYPETFPVAILAGGLATRMRPLTQEIPKALIEVAGRPFVHRQLDYLARQGIAKVVLCVGYRGEQIESAVGDGRQFSLAVSYSYDGQMLLGTGGALKRALPALGGRFFVLYGDSYLPCDFRTVQRAFVDRSQPALMTVLRNENRWDRSNVLFRGGLVLEYNKDAPRPEMDYIDYGLGILSAPALAPYPQDGPFDLADVYHELSMAGQLAGFEVSRNQRFYEIGSRRGLQEAETYFSTRDGA